MEFVFSLFVSPRHPAEPLLPDGNFPHIDINVFVQNGKRGPQNLIEEPTFIEEAIESITTASSYCEGVARNQTYITFFLTSSFLVALRDKGGQIQVAVQVRSVISL